MPQRIYSTFGRNHPTRQISKRLPKSPSSAQSVASRISLMYESKRTEGLGFETAQEAVSPRTKTDKIIHERVEEELFGRIGRNLATVSLLLDRAAQSMKEDDSNEVNPDACLEYARIFAQIRKAGEAYSRIINPILEQLCAASGRNPSAFGGSLLPENSADKTVSSSLHDLFLSLGGLLESIEQLGRVFKDDVEVQRIMKMLATDKGEISDSFSALSAILRSTSPKWRHRIEFSEKFMSSRKKEAILPAW